MPKNPDIKKVLVIGSGPIVIGQAAEFVYAGTQACRSLKEEGIEVVLLNSNPATIMTDKDIADRVCAIELNREDFIFFHLRSLEDFAIFADISQIVIAAILAIFAVPAVRKVDHFFLIFDGKLPGIV